jgi:hypothetical protein
MVLYVSPCPLRFVMTAVSCWILLGTFFDPDQGRHFHFQVVHDLSVAYNKLGDLHYLAKRPDEAREEYLQSLELRQNAHTADSTASQVMLSLNCY